MFSCFRALPASPDASPANDSALEEVQRQMRRPMTRRFSNEEAVFVSQPPEVTAKLEAAIEKSVGSKLTQEAQSSLCATMDDLHLNASAGPAERSRVAKRSYNELSDFVEAARKDVETELFDFLQEQGSEGEDTLLSQISETQEEVFNEMESDCLVRMGSLDLCQVEEPAIRFLKRIGLRAQEAGARNQTRWRRRVLWNQCFYLSIAQAYLGQQAGLKQIRGLALRMRHAVEAAVLEKNPSYAAELKASADGTGQAMVFADFLPFAMNAESSERNFLAKLAVCVLDSVNGHVEVYMGPQYLSLEDQKERERNLILIWYKPWHYQCLVRDDEEGSKVAMSYDAFKILLVQHGVVYIETLE